MLLIPDIEAVVLLNPKTGSTSLMHAVQERYPRAMPLYRHMEADGVPPGYDRWTKIIVVREPVARLWSMYSSIREFAERPNIPAFLNHVRQNAELNFDDWIIGTTADPGEGMKAPAFAWTGHRAVFTRKSQWEFARPDLGTELFRYEELDALERRLDLKLGRHGTRSRHPAPRLNDAARAHVEIYFAWDVAFFAQDRSAAPICAAM